MGSNKSLTSFLFLYLIGSTLCVIPEGEYQFGPVFPGAGEWDITKYLMAH